MRVSVFGLGYVGAVSCACFAKDGLDVIGVDLNATKVAAINNGDSPIVEKGLSELIAEGIRTSRLRATGDVVDAVLNSDVSVVAVGTPGSASGRLSLDAVQRVSEQIGQAIRHKKPRHLVVVRSTILPGSMRDVVVPALERGSGRTLGDGFGACFNPEFLREGSSIEDHYHPPYTLIGSWETGDGERAAMLYAGVTAPTVHVSVETAEMVKYVCNAFHAVKITFANEMGILAQACGVDSKTVMDLVCRDTKLNISPRYLAPGFAFGGSCLPKDLRALLHRAREADVEMPMTRGVLESNRAQVDRAIQFVLQSRRRRIGLFGISFKAGTDDLRESPLVALAEALIGKGLDLRICDPSVAIARLVGANREYIEREIPHLSALMVDDVRSVAEHGELLVIGNDAPDFRQLPQHLKPGHIVLDLVGRNPALGADGVHYRGIAW